MNETKRMIVTLIIIVVIIMLLPLSLYIKHVNGDKKINAIREIYKTADNSLIYISSSKCDYCDKFNPVIDDVSKDYNFKYAYIDIIELTNTQIYELFELLEIDQNDFGTPYLVTGEKGKTTSENTGYLSKSDFIGFLKDSGFLAANAEPKMPN